MSRYRGLDFVYRIIFLHYFIIMSSKHLNASERLWIFDYFEQKKRESLPHYSLDEEIKVTKQAFREKFGDARVSALSEEKIKKIIKEGRPLWLRSKSKDAAVRPSQTHSSNLRSSTRSSRSLHHQASDGSVMHDEDHFFLTTFQTIHEENMALNNEPPLPSTAAQPMEEDNDDEEDEPEAAAAVANQPLNAAISNPLASQRRPGRENPSNLRSGIKSVKRSIMNNCVGTAEKLARIANTVDELNKREEYHRPIFTHPIPNTAEERRALEENLTDADEAVEEAVRNLRRAVSHRLQYKFYVSDPTKSAAIAVVSKDSHKNYHSMPHNLTSDAVTLLTQISDSFFATTVTNEGGSSSSSRTNNKNSSSSNKQ
jgi:hypothetical protein